MNIYVCIHVRYMYLAWARSTPGPGPARAGAVLSYIILYYLILFYIIHVTVGGGVLRPLTVIKVTGNCLDTASY